MGRRFPPRVGIGPACANIGVPVTPLPAGNPTDLGLGGFLESVYKVGGNFNLHKNIHLTARYIYSPFLDTLYSINHFF